MITHKHKAIFIHIPKCAGTSMERHLRDYANGIEDSLYRKKELAAHILLHNSYFLFTFIRNPFDRLISTWRHSNRFYGKSLYYSPSKKRPDHVSLYDYINYIKDSSMDFLSGFDEYHTLPQYGFMLDFNDNFFSVKMNKKFDFIGKYENLFEDYEKLCGILNINNTVLPHAHHGSNKDKKDYRLYYDSKTIDLVIQVYKKDFELLGYSMEL